MNVSKRSRTCESTSGRGVDVVFDPVGGDVFHRSTKIMAFGGRLLVIGFAGGDIPSVQANRILLKNISIVGLHWGNYQIHDPQALRDAHQRITQMCDNGAIDPLVSMSLPLKDLKEGLAAIENRKSTGKVVVVNSRA